MELKFMQALDKVLSEKIIKNERVLCMTAGVDQGGVNKYLKTMRYRLGKGEKPEKLKDNLNLDIVSKLVDVMGGQLIFPWDENYNDMNAEIARLQKENEKLKNENSILDKKLFACQQMKEEYKAIITQQLPTVNGVPVEARQDKSCA